MRNVRAAIVAGVFLLAGISAAHAETWTSELLRDHPLVGKIYDTQANTFVTQEVLLNRIRTSKHVLLGEIHDNADHHALQARVITELVALGRKPAIVFEMISAEQAPALEGLKIYNSDFGQTVPDALRNALRWDESGWPAFAIYEPVFAAALGAKLHISAGEPAASSKVEVDKLLADAPLLKPLADALNEELKVGHCGVLPEAVIPKVAVAQRKRDIKLMLAMTATDASGKDGTVLIAGSGHARQDRGVPHYLRHTGRSSVTINFREVSENKNAPGDLIEDGEADYVWFTPRHKREDPCVALLKRFGKTKK